MTWDSKLFIESVLENRMLPKVGLYLDLDDVVYGKDIYENGRRVRKGHLSWDVISAGVRPKQVVQSLRKRKHKIIRTGFAAIGLLFSSIANSKKKNFRTAQYLLEMLLKNSSEDELEYLMRQGAKQSLKREERAKLENKIYPLKPLIEKYPGLEIEVNYISLESGRLQKILASKSGVNVKRFYQTRSTYQKIEFVETLAERKPDNFYILVDDKVKPEYKKNRIFLNDIHNLPKVLDEINFSEKKEGYVVVSQENRGLPPISNS